jgi:hypothetical protein
VLGCYYGRFSVDLLPLFLRAFQKLRQATISSIMSDRLSARLSFCLSAYNNSSPTGRILMKFDIQAFFFRKYIGKIQVSLHSVKNNGYCTWRCYHIYDNISLNSSSNEKYFKQICRENRNTHFKLNKLFFKFVPFIRQYGSIWSSQWGRKRCHSMVHTRCMLDKESYMHAHAQDLVHPHAFTRKHIQANV